MKSKPAKMKQAHPGLQLPLFFSMLLAAFPAVASDFSGFLTVFVGLPLLALLNLLLGFVASCRAVRSATVAACICGILCLAGILFLVCWLSRILGGAWWYVAAPLVLLLIALFCFSWWGKQQIKVWTNTANVVLTAVVLLGTLMLIDVVSVASQKGNAGIMLYLFPLLLLLVVAFGLRSLIVRPGKGVSWTG